MSNVRGRIAIDVLFTDSTTSSEEKSLKTVAMQDATEYTSGKVAVIAGTCGTQATTVASLGEVLPYRDATGDQVSFAAFARVSLSGSPAVILGGQGLYEGVGVRSESNRASVTDLRTQAIAPAVPHNLNIRATSGTASYTLVLYGS